MPRFLALVGTPVPDGDDIGTIAEGDVEVVVRVVRGRQGELDLLVVGLPGAVGELLGREVAEMADAVDIDHVIVAAVDDDVRALGEVAGVDTGAAFEQVVAFAALQPIAVGAADQRVAALLAVDRIGADAAFDVVVG